MTQEHIQTSAAAVPLGLMDFGKMQERYQALSVSRRAAAAIEDAKPALQAAESILESLAGNPKAALAFEHIRKNAVIIGKMRASEAKTVLLDNGGDFVTATVHKLASWRKTLERLEQGEGVVKDKTGEYVPVHMPVAAAMATMNTAGGYLAVIHLALNDLVKTDSKHADQYRADAAKIRRCATLISDCETAAGIATLVR